MTMALPNTTHLVTIMLQARVIYHTTVIGRCTRNQKRSTATRQTRYQLNTGASIPAIDFGTFQDPEAQEDSVARALQTGMRLVDSARVYDVKKQIGRSIKRSGIPREEIFPGTKLWCSSYHPDDVERTLDESLADLDTLYVDLFLRHYPCTFARGEDRFPWDRKGKMILGKDELCRHLARHEEAHQDRKSKDHWGTQL